MVEVKQLRGGHQWDQNPWLEKLPPDSTLYRLDRPSVDDMNLPHIMDVLREDLVAGRISPSDLKNISIDRAVRRTHEYNQEMAKKAEEATAKKLEGMTVYKEYPNGFKWVKLEKPGDFAAESDAMGHSVRGYEPPPRHPDWVEGSGDRGTPSYGLGGWEAIKSGKAQVYSLVDPKGNPHATIEAGEVRSPRYEEIRNHFDEAHKEVLADMNARGMDISDPTRANGLAWKRAEEIAREQGYQFVNQIKGKGNDRPINKYDPYTQDFVTSGDWTEVRDLQNTGLKLVGEAFPRRDDQLGFQKLFPEQRYVTPDEVNAYKTKADQDLIDQYKDWKSKVDFEDPQFKDYEGPEFISNEEYFKRYFPDDPAAQADFIRGGMDSPSMTPPESLGMKDWDTLMNEGVFSYDDVSFLNKVMPQRYLTAEDIAKAKARLEEPPLAEKSGGVIHMKKGGDDLEAEYKELSKPAFYPKVGNIKSKNYKSPQNKPFVDDPRAMEIPDVDVDVPTKENLEMSRRLAQRQGELEKQIQADRSPLDKLAGTIQGGRLLGSAMLQGINSMPTRLVHGDKAAEKFIQDRIYKPTNELGVEYAGDTAKFLEELETKYKLPPVAMGDVLGFAPLIQAGVGQAAKAAGSGTKNFAKALAETAGEKIAMGQPLVPGVPASITNPMVKHIIKPEGGNWQSGNRSVESRLKPYKQGAHDVDPRDAEELGIQLSPQDAALNKWIDSNLTNYMKKQLGTESDPIRKLADEGITHYADMNAMRNDLGSGYNQTADNKKLRQKFGMPPYSIAETPMGKSWEEGVDALIGNETQLLSKYGTQARLKKDPWMANLPKDTPFYGMPPRGFYSDLGMSHIIDVLREDLATGRIRPEQLNKVSMRQAVQRSHEYNQEMAKKAEAAQAKKLEDMTIYKEYPEGFRWVQLNKPGQFAAESDAMGHSVRGYEPPQGHPDYIPESGNAGSESYGLGGWEAIKSGDAKIYSLIDKDNKPHTTIEIGKGNDAQAFFDAHKNYLDNPVTNRDLSMMVDPDLDIPLDTQRVTAMKQLLDEMGVQYRDVPEAPPHINQIKGKGNRTPNEQYLPYVQDFVKSGKWSQVNDIDNSGLIEHSGRYFTEPELIEAAKKHGRMGVQDVPWEVARQRHMEAGISEDEALRNWIEAFKEGRGKLDIPPEGQKRGGLIHMAEGGSSYHPDVQDALKAGRITPNQAKWMSNYYKTPGNPEIGTAGIRDGISEKMMNYRNAVRAGEYTRPNWMESIPKEVKLPKWFDGKLDLDREGLRQLDKIPGMTKKAFNASEYSNTFPAGVNDANYYNELLKASKEAPDYQPYIDELNKLRERNQDIGKQDGGLIYMGPGGLIKNLLKMTAKEEALSKLPQMKAELAAKQALEAEYRKAMRDIPYDQQITLKEWESTRIPSASDAYEVTKPNIPKAKGGLTK